MDTRDKISFSLPKTLFEAKEEQIRAQTISISCCCFSTPSFLKIEMRIASRILSSRANARSSDRSSVRIEVGFVLFRNERATHHHRVSKRRGSFATELQTKKNKKKKASLFCVPRTKTSRVFGRPFLRWTRRSRSKFAKPISRNVVASSFRSWRPTLSRSCGWTGR